MSTRSGETRRLYFEGRHKRNVGGTVPERNIHSIIGAAYIVNLDAGESIAARSGGSLSAILGKLQHQLISTDLGTLRLVDCKRRMP